MIHSHKKSASNRVNPQLRNWYNQVSGENIPATSIFENVESFAELLKAQHVLGSVTIAGLIESSTKYNTNSTGECSFAIGKNLETLGHKSTLTECGKNTLNTITRTSIS
jgi:poly(3-hydroxyalkanoate) synthetase